MLLYVKLACFVLVALTACVPKSMLVVVAVMFVARVTLTLRIYLYPVAPAVDLSLMCVAFSGRVQL